MQEAIHLSQQESAQMLDLSSQIHKELQTMQHTLLSKDKQFQHLQQQLLQQQQDFAQQKLDSQTHLHSQNNLKHTLATRLQQIKQENTQLLTDIQQQNQQTENFFQSQEQKMAQNNNYMDQLKQQIEEQTNSKHKLSEISLHQAEKQVQMQRQKEEMLKLQINNDIITLEKEIGDLQRKILGNTEGKIRKKDKQCQFIIERAIERHSSSKEQNQLYIDTLQRNKALLAKLKHKSQENQKILAGFQPDLAAIQQQNQKELENNAQAIKQGQQPLIDKLSTDIKDVVTKCDLVKGKSEELQKLCKELEGILAHEEKEKESRRVALHTSKQEATLQRQQQLHSLQETQKQGLDPLLDQFQQQIFELDQSKLSLQREIRDLKKEKQQKQSQFNEMHKRQQELDMQIESLKESIQREKENMLNKIKERRDSKVDLQCKLEDLQNENKRFFKEKLNDKLNLEQKAKMAEQMQERIQQLQTHVASQKEKLFKIKQDIECLTKERKELNKRFECSDEQLRSQEHEIADCERRIKGLMTQATEEDQEKEELLKELSRSVKRLQRRGRELGVETSQFKWE